jgi:ribonucleoside-diphosphate reductase alpha chain
MSAFRTTFSRDIFFHKYAHSSQDTWPNLARRSVDDVTGTFQGKGDPILTKEERDQLTKYIEEMKFIPGGRYIYYAGRPMHAWNNCFLLKGETDTREEWGRLLKSSSDCLMLGGGIGIDYSVFRPKNAPLVRTGGKASGPLPLMNSINEVGRNVMQGGSRRSAIYASLNWQHDDITEFLKIKNWHNIKVGNSGQTLWDIKQSDFNFPAPLDMTNISLNYDNRFLDAVLSGELPETFLENVNQALRTGEPGFSFNFGTKERETLRNACTEVSSEDDSDVCNLGSVNFSRIESIEELASVTYLASKFLVCGTLRASLPYEKVYRVREKNRRLGLGLMGLHEWLIKRGYRYEVVDELKQWLGQWQINSEIGANTLCDSLGISRPVAYRAIAPTGSIGILAATTTGIEPIFAVAYKRRYLSEGHRWQYQYVVENVAEHLIQTYNVNPDSIETAIDLAKEPERRIKFQADVQDFVDMSISSTINLPSWGTDLNNQDKVEGFARTLAKYAPRLRGFTCYPDGSRGGQPLTPIAYRDAVKHKGVVFDETDICVWTGKGGSCGS